MADAKLSALPAGGAIVDADLFYSAQSLSSVRQPASAFRTYVLAGGPYLTTAAAASTYAPIASPTFTGDPKAPTATAGDNDTSIATTAFVQAAIGAPYGRPQRFISGAAGAVSYAATDQIVTFGVTSGTGITYALPTAATRNSTGSGAPISFKDVTGCFAAHNLTINCSETIDGVAAPLVLSNNAAGVTLYPRTDGGTGWFTL